MDTVTFGIVGQFDSIGAEKELSPCVRITVSGTGNIIMTPCSSLVA